MSFTAMPHEKSIDPTIVFEDAIDGVDDSQQHHGLPPMPLSDWSDITFWNDRQFYAGLGKSLFQTALSAL